jgi:hypothetical protein
MYCGQGITLSFHKCRGIFDYLNNYHLLEEYLLRGDTRADMCNCRTRTVCFDAHIWCRRTAVLRVLVR